MLACIYSVNYVIQSFNNYFVFHTKNVLLCLLLVKCLFSGLLDIPETNTVNYLMTGCNNSAF